MGLRFCNVGGFAELMFIEWLMLVYLLAGALAHDTSTWIGSYARNERFVMSAYTVSRFITRDSKEKGVRNEKTSLMSTHESTFVLLPDAHGRRS